MRYSVRIRIKFTELKNGCNLFSNRPWSRYRFVVVVVDVVCNKFVGHESIRGSVLFLLREVGVSEEPPDDFHPFVRRRLLAHRRLFTFQTYTRRFSSVQSQRGSSGGRLIFSLCRKILSFVCIVEKDRKIAWV